MFTYYIHVRSSEITKTDEDKDIQLISHANAVINIGSSKKAGQSSFSRKWVAMYFTCNSVIHSKSQSFDPKRKLEFQNFLCVAVFQEIRKRIRSCL